MALVIPNARGWKAREAAAQAKAQAKADPGILARSKLRTAMHGRDNARGEAQRAEDRVRAAEDQVMSFRGAVASYEAWSVSSLRVHPQLGAARQEAEMAESLLSMAEAQLAVARVRLVEAEAAFLTASGRYVEDTAADDAAPVETPAVALVPVATVEPPIATPTTIPVVPVAKVPARVDAGVSLSDDDALAALEPTKRRTRR